MLSFSPRGRQGQSRHACHPCRCPSYWRPRPTSAVPLSLVGSTSYTPSPLSELSLAKNPLQVRLLFIPPLCPVLRHTANSRRLCVPCSPRRGAVSSVTCDTDRLLHALLHFLLLMYVRLPHPLICATYGQVNVPPRGQSLLVPRRSLGTVSPPVSLKTPCSAEGGASDPALLRPRCDVDSPPMGPASGSLSPAPP